MLCGPRADTGCQGWLKHVSIMAAWELEAGKTRSHSRGHSTESSGPPHQTMSDRVSTLKLWGQEQGMEQILPEVKNQLV